MGCLGIDDESIEGYQIGLTGYRTRSQEESGNDVSQK